MGLFKRTQRLLGRRDPLADAVEQYRQGNTGTPVTARAEESKPKGRRAKRDPGAPAYQRFIDGPSARRE